MEQLAGLRAFLGDQRRGLVALLDDLTLEQATSTPTASDLSLFAIVKHCAFVERRWVLGVIDRRRIPGIVPAEHREQEFRDRARQRRRARRPHRPRDPQSRPRHEPP
jgi:hypothetical protein